MPTPSDLSQVQGGDQVIVRRHRYGGEDHLSLAEVERTTKTQIIVLGVRYRKCDGKEMAAGRHPNYIEVPTSKTLKIVKCERAKGLVLDKLNQVRWADLSGEVLIQVYAVLVHAEVWENECTTQGTGD